MRLTPLDIRHKEFARSMRGYKDLEVDEFLDDIADEFERLFNENIDYKDRLESLEEKIEQYRNIEDTLKKTLVSAQQQAEEMKQNAKKEADLILRDAELKSRSIINDSYAERQKIQRSVSALKQKQEDLRYQLKSVIESYSNILDQDNDTGLDEAAEAEFTSLSGSETSGAESTSLPGATAPDAEEENPPGMDTAVSREIMGEGAAAGPEAMGSTGGSSISKNGESSAFKDEGTAREKDAVLIPPLDPAAKQAEEEDPFADVEMDTGDHKFKW